MAKNAEHITIRNQNLFCEHCGKEGNIPTPISIRVLGAYIEDFTELHKNCEKRWKQPMPSLALSIPARAQFWLDKGERGISSETMFSILAEEFHPLRGIDTFCHPLDPDDFRRCYLLLKMLPEWKNALYKMKSVSPVWEKLVDNWEKLEEMLEEMMKTNKDNGMYKFMKSLGC